MKDVRLVQQIAGHSSLEQTAVYTEVADEDLRAGMAALGTYAA